MNKARTRKEENDLLKILSEDFGYEDADALLEEAVYDSVAAGICPECHYSTEVEPDCHEGWCENCNEGTVVSCLVLAGII